MNSFGPPQVFLQKPPHPLLATLPKRLVELWVCAAFLLSVLTGCSPGKNDVLTREQMWEWVDRNVQVGMPLETASAVMGKAGFECTSLSKTSAKIIDRHKAATVGTFDLLKCEREDGEPPIKRHWEVSLVREGAKVKAIGVRYRDVYPSTKSGSDISAE